MSDRVTALVVMVLGAAIALAGDACHVVSGTTHYDVQGMPTVWKSALWFPIAVGLAVLGGAWLGARSPPCCGTSR